MGLRTIRQTLSVILIIALCITMTSFVGLYAYADATGSEIVGITYELEAPIVYEEHTNGQWSIDQNGNFYYRYRISPTLIKSFIVEYKDGSKTEYEYFGGLGDPHYSREEYQDKDGNKIQLYNPVRSKQEIDHFEVGTDNYFYFTYNGFEVEIPVTITATSASKEIESINYTPAKPIVYNTSQSMEVYNGSEDTYQYWWNNDYCRDYFKVGDILTISNLGGEDIPYVYNNSNGGTFIPLMPGDYEKIMKDELTISDDQNLLSGEWSPEKGGYSIIEYKGAVTKVPITIEKVISGTLGDNISYSYNENTGTLYLSRGIAEAEASDFNMWNTFRNETQLFNESANIKKVMISSDFNASERSTLLLIEQFTSLESVESDSNNAKYSTLEGVLYNKIKTELYYYPPQKDGEEFTIPETVTHIGADCDTSSFGTSQKLKSVHIPASVKTIKLGAFKNIVPSKDNLIEEISVADSNQFFSSEDGVLYSKDGTKLITYPDGKKLVKFEILNDVTCIGNWSFSFSKSLNEVIIPSTVINIERNAFRHSNVKTVTFDRLPGLVVFPENELIAANNLERVNLPCDIEWDISQSELKNIITYTHSFKNYVYNNDEGNGTYGTETAECEYGCGATDTRNRDCPIDEFHFPDVVFREYVADNIDTDKNLKLSPGEIAAVTEIDLSGTSELRNLEGIYYFVNLQYLNCSGTEIDHLELYNNKELRTLYCNNTNLTQLDEPGLKKLESVSIKNSPLEYIALDSDNLYYLHVNDTKLKNLYAGTLTGIKYLNVMNTDISELDLSNSSELWSLFCDNTNISVLDLSHNTKLTLLSCENTPMKELILSDHPEVDAVYARRCNLIAFRLSDAYDVSDFDVKYEDGLDFGEPGTLINLKEQNINTIPEGRTEFNLTEWAPNIEPGRISNLQGATLNGTTLTGFKADSQITYTYDCGAGFTMDVVINVPKKNVSTGISGGYYVPTVQKPTVEVNEGAAVELSKDGTSATITVGEEYEVVDVLLNGVSVGKVTKVEKLKTGDKLTVQTISKTDLQKEEMKTAITGTKLAARSKLVTMKNGKKAIKITWYDKSENDVIFDGVEIKRSLKRNSGYGTKPYFVSVTDQYYNTAIKNGKTYYYKVRGFVVIDGEKYYTDWSLKAIRTA